MKNNAQKALKIVWVMASSTTCAGMKICSWHWHRSAPSATHHHDATTSTSGLIKSPNPLFHGAPLSISHSDRQHMHRL